MNNTLLHHNQCMTTTRQYATISHCTEPAKARKKQTNKQTRKQTNKQTNKTDGPRSNRVHKLPYQQYKKAQYKNGQDVAMLKANVVLARHRR